MAATLVGGAFLSGTVQTILDNITSSDFRQYFANRKLNVTLLDELQTTLLTLNAVLDDAEEKQVTNPAVKEWLDKLQDAIFDTEDMLDQVSTDSLRCKVEETRPQSMKDQVWKFLSSPFDQFYRDINSKMESLSRKLLSFEKQKDILGLQVARGRASQRKPTCSLVNESVIVGRREDKEELMKMLLSESDEDTNVDNVGVVAIFGMGGVGKTTLAQLIYNNKQVQEHFDLKGWACVSEDFDAVRVTKSLLESVTSKVHDSNNLDFLRVELKQRLKGKKFLFVLDDLWNDKYNVWDDLRIPFGDGKAGSKVIITTRQQRVAEITHTFPIYKLEPLSDEDCWSLLAKHAFGSGNLSRHPNLHVIGRKIAKNCDGLPLAAKALGGLLRSKVDPKEWDRVLSSNIWDIPNDDVLPALHLSYLHLPAQLKRCFAYCSVFPKGYPLDRKQLVLLWMAEGLIQSQGEKTMEEIGDAYFVELLSRSLVQHFEDGNGEMFVMHDLVNDLARVISAKSCFRIECGEIPETVRHLSYIQECYDHSKRFEDLHKLKYLRSLISLSHKGWTSYLARKVLEDLLPKLRWLRVLSLSSYKNITMLPDSIGSLVHLRYLDLSHTEIRRLPDIVCKLYNLQSLILTECYFLTELPEDIDKLLSLRYLDISGTNLKQMPMQVGGLRNLQTLTTFVVSREQEGSKVRELRKLPHLRGKLSILGLQNVVDAMDAFDANLKCKDRIEELMLEWGNYTEDSRLEKEVLKQLQPSKNLRKLTINSYSGTSFPSWVGDHSYYNMVSICISNCDYCILLPPLGQLPSLKELFILSMKLETVGAELYGKIGGSYSVEPFPSLQHLKFQDMPNWKEWLLPLAGEGNRFAFPCLKSLHLIKCPKLKGHLPNHLPSLTEVEILGCYQLHSGIEHSDALPSLPKMILSSDCLRILNLYGIPSIICFPASGLPTSLRSLHISYCENLTFLPLEAWCNYTSLVTLKIWYSCDSLVSFYLNCFPALESVSLGGCINLQALCISEASAHCPSHLRSVHLDYCKMLRSLPGNMDTLTALESLSMSRLPKLESFPQGGLPANLVSLFVYDCGRLSPVGIAYWGLQQHTALSSVHIEGKCNGLVKALLKEPLLPTSLVSLIIYSPSSMKFLEGDGLRHLTSLEVLRILSSPTLESLPKEGLQHLTSLKELGIHGCPMLKSLPDDTLPPSLSLLRITKCPLLEARYNSQRGEHWSKIAHMPVIQINELVII